MNRSHVAVLGRWLQALGVATVYVAVAAGLFWLDLGDAGEAPTWAVVAVPLVYAALSLVFLRRASPAHHLTWMGSACLTHVALGAAAAVAFTLVVDVTVLSALAHALARLGPVPLLTFVATPLALAPFRGREASTRTAPRRARARAATATTPVVPTGAAPVVPTTSPAPTAPPAPAAGNEMPTLRDPRPRKLIADSDEPAASAISRAAKSSEAVADMAGDDEVVRVRFDRIAGQLPARAFTLPLDRVAESLREPHWITVPRRIVLEQLPEGAIQVPWPIVAAQFPELAFAMSDVEFRQKFPDLKLTLPLDDVLRQLPRGMFSMEPTPSAIAGLDAFPPPFQPLAVPREAPAATPPPGEAGELPPAVVTATAPATPPPPARAPRPTTPVAPPSAPVAAPAPPPVVTPPSPIVAPSVASAPRRAAASDVVGRDAVTQLAACLTGAGTFEAWTGIVDDTPLVAFVEPAVSRDAVTAVAARVAGLLGAAAGEQVTVRTARAAIIVSAAPTPVVVAARRPGAPVALLELRAAQAASKAGRASEGATLPSRTLSALTVEPRVAAVASALGASFGLVDPAVLADAGGAARVYVFRESGREAAHLGQLALAVWEGLGRASDRDLGALVSVVFRQGRRRILVRPVGSRGTALLAAAGPVARPGRAWRDADRAAAALETR
jgi:hypothetical protein